MWCSSLIYNVVGWTKKPISPRFVYPSAAKLCCCVSYKTRRACDRIFSYVRLNKFKKKTILFECVGNQIMLNSFNVKMYNVGIPLY